MQHIRTLFLGSGYTGNYFRYLYPYSIHSFRSREKMISLGGGGVLFDANNKETWANIKSVMPGAIVISFPLNECLCALDLRDFIFSFCSTILIIGTTSAFSPHLNKISDNSQLDMPNPRNIAEETFRTSGASVIHSAGIYGKNRNPLDWIRRGLIKNRTSKVNLIHGEDLARAARFILENFKEKQRYVISDNRPYSWDEIIRFAVNKNYLLEPAISSDEIRHAGRIVKPEKIFKMGFMLKHPYLFEEISRLEQSPNNKPDPLL